MEQGTCEECRRLLENYRAALLECIKLHGKLRVAFISSYLATTDRISEELLAANQVRTASRQAIREHEKIAHADRRSTWRSR